MTSPRLPRGIAWFALATGVFLIVGGIAVWRSRSAGPPAAPAAYFVSAGPDLLVRLGWRHVHVRSALPLRSGQRLLVPAGASGWLLTQDGKVQPVTSALRFTVAPAVSSELEFLTAPLAQLAVSPPLSGPPPLKVDIPITSPSGLTRFLNPKITWVARPGVLYDVAVIDPADDAAPPRILRKVRPPVRVSDLQTTQRPELPADRIFGVLVRESGNSAVAGINRFLTGRDATTDDLASAPSQLLAEAVQALSEKPMRIGDAWLALSRLPPEWMDNELTLRLRLKAAAELGVSEELSQLQAEARRRAGLRG